MLNLNIMLIRRAQRYELPGMVWSYWGTLRVSPMRELQTLQQQWKGHLVAEKGQWQMLSGWGTRPLRRGGGRLRLWLWMLWVSALWQGQLPLGWRRWLLYHCHNNINNYYYHHYHNNHYYYYYFYQWWVLVESWEQAGLSHASDRVIQTNTHHKCLRLHHRWWPWNHMRPDYVIFGVWGCCRISWPLRYLSWWNKQYKKRSSVLLFGGRKSMVQWGRDKHGQVQQRG